MLQPSNNDCDFQANDRTFAQSTNWSESKHPAKQNEKHINITIFKVGRITNSKWWMMKYGGQINHELASLNEMSYISFSIENFRTNQRFWLLFLPPQPSSSSSYIQSKWTLNTKYTTLIDAVEMKYLFQNGRKLHFVKSYMFHSRLCATSLLNKKKK